MTVNALLLAELAKTRSPRPRLTRATHPCPLVRSWACAVPCFTDDCRDPDKHEERTDG